MRSSLEQMERVAAYMSGNLTPDERIRFESELAGDPVLQEQLDFQRDVARIAQRRALRSEINAVAKQYGGSSGLSWITVTIAGLAVIGGIAAFVFFSDTSEKPQQQTVVQPATNPDTAQPQNDPVTPPLQATGTSAPAITPLDFAAFMKDSPMDNLPFIDFTPAEMQQEDSAEFGIAEHTVPFEQLDFLPEGFADEVARLTPEDAELTKERIEEIYFGLSGKLYISARSWTKAESSGSLSKTTGMIRKRTTRKKTASGFVIDSKGDKMKNVRIEFSYFGEKEVVTTDANGEFSFRLYSRIVTDVKLVIPEYGETTLQNIAFEPKNETYFQLELPAEEQMIRVASAEATESCYISPASIRALKDPAFAHSFIATKDFERRLKVLHTLENGDALLELYVAGIYSPIRETDQLVASKLSGANKRTFEAFAAENSVNPILTTGKITSEAMVNHYRRNKELYGNRPVKSEDPEMSVKLQEFIVPCK